MGDVRVGTRGLGSAEGVRQGGLLGAGDGLGVGPRG